jgi:hypothetical protein
MIVPAGKKTVVVVLHTDNGNWRFDKPSDKPWGERSHNSASGRLCTKTFSNRILLYALPDQAFNQQKLSNSAKRCASKRRETE